MKNTPIIFCHYGFSKYLPYVFETVRKSNPDKKIILLGDESNKKVAKKFGLLHFDLSDFDYGQDLKLFDEVYELITAEDFDSFKHKQDWNKFVFRKWFVLHNFLQKNDIESFWHFDSDVMIFSQLSKLEHFFEHLDCTVQCGGGCMKGYFGNRKIIENYNKKINEVFLRKDFIAKVKKETKELDGLKCFSEMSVYGIFEKEEKFKSFQLAEIIGKSSFDDLICRGYGFKMEKLPLGEDTKIVHLNDDGRFFCIDEATGDAIHFHALNLSWTPIYIYNAILKHFKKNFRKNDEPFNLNSITLAQVKVPLWKKFKHYRKQRKRIRSAE